MIFEENIEEICSRDGYWNDESLKREVKEILDAVRELVAEAKPKDKVVNGGIADSIGNAIAKQTIDKYEANLLAALGGSGKSFFDYPDAEKESIIRHAAEESNSEQRKLMKKPVNDPIELF